MSFFVYYHDDYYDSGGVGFEKFDSSELAAKFINERMSKREKPDADNYTVIMGTPLKVEAIEVAVRVRLRQ